MELAPYLWLIPWVFAIIWLGRASFDWKLEFIDRLTGFSGPKRDLNAARNHERLATETAMPEASPSGNGGDTAKTIPAVAGGAGQYPAGQKENRAHIRALSLERHSECNLN